MTSFLVQWRIDWGASLICLNMADTSTIFDCSWEVSKADAIQNMPCFRFVLIDFRLNCHKKMLFLCTARHKSLSVSVWSPFQYPSTPGCRYIFGIRHPGIDFHLSLLLSGGECQDMIDISILDVVFIQDFLQLQPQGDMIQFWYAHIVEMGGKKHQLTN